MCAGPSKGKKSFSGQEIRRDDEKLRRETSEGRRGKHMRKGGEKKGK